jgi:acetyl-CoA acetyltransferase
MEDIAIVSFAQTPSYRRYPESEPALLMELVNAVLEETGLERREIDFTIAGSCDYLSGMPFAFISNVDAFGAWPPVYESHVEMDGAWALFEGFVRMQLGDIDTCLVAGSGKSSPGRPREIFPLQADPYYHAPLGLDPVSMAGIQAQCLLDAGKASERRDGLANPFAQVARDVSPDELLKEPYYASPLRRHDLPPISDGAAVVLLARGAKARALTRTPVWIRGIDHRMESHHPGLRDLTALPGLVRAAQKLAIHAKPIDVAELCVRYSPEEIVLREALGLSGGARINPSGGPLCGHPVMATGLVRVVEAARRIARGEARRAIAHAASGAALQQNLLCVLEGGA